MAPFVLRKLILQTHIRCLIFGRTLCLLPYFLCANSKGSHEAAGNIKMCLSMLRMILVHLFFFCFFFYKFADQKIICDYQIITLWHIFTSVYIINLLIKRFLSPLVRGISFKDVWTLHQQCIMTMSSFLWSLMFFKWAASWHNQQNGMCAQRRFRSAWASAQSDQSSLCAQWVAKDPSFLHADSKDWSDCADVQADLSLRWAHMTFCWFCHEAAQIVSCCYSCWYNVMYNLSYRK